MAKMNIELYRGIIKKAQKLICKCHNYVNGANINGLKPPMTFFDEIQAISSEVNQCIGNLTLVTKTLNKDSNKEYQCLLQELRQIDIELKELEKAFLKH